MKKQIALFAIIGLLLLLLPLIASADTIASGTCGDNLTWELDNNYILTISGSGAMYDYNYINPGLSPWIEAGIECLIKEIHLPDGLTTIGDYAFWSFSSVKSIHIPDSVTTIGNNSFLACDGLIDITIPRNVDTIRGVALFNGCYSLQNIYVSEDNNYYSSYDGALYDKNRTELIRCPPGKTQLIIPNDANISSIRSRAFSLDCEKLITIYYKKSQEDWNSLSIGSDNDILSRVAIIYYGGRCGENLTWAFNDDNGLLSISGMGDTYDYTWDEPAPWYPFIDSITSVSLDNRITGIGNRCFENCLFTSVEIPYGVTKIGMCAFIACTELNSVTIPDSVTYIGHHAFGGCSKLDHITLPGSLVSLGEGAFSSCLNMKTVVIEEGLQEIPTNTFEMDYFIRNITIPSSVKHIGSNAFSSPSWNSDVYYNGSEEDWNYITNENLSYFENNTVTMHFLHEHVWGKPTYTWDDDNLSITAIRICCVNKKHVETETVEVTGVITTTPSCTTKGKTTYTSNVFENTAFLTQTKTIENIDALGHDTVHHNAKAATCTEKGWNEYDTCSRCDYTTYTELSANGHTEVTDAAVAATCTKAGLTAGSHCSVCNEVLVAQEVVPANGHTEVTDAAVAATCTKAGLTAGLHCSACNEVLVAQEVVPANGHTMTPHAKVDATCTRTGTEAYCSCDVCGHLFSDKDGKNKIDAPIAIAPDGHTLIKHDKLQPTYTTTGTEEYWRCSKCGKLFSDAGGTAQINKPVEIPMLTSTPTLTPEPTTVTVKGLKYKLDNKAKIAIVTGAEKKTITKLTIPASIKANGKTYKVTAIDKNAFKKYTKLKEVTIGKNITKIGKNAFNGCKKLKTITIKAMKLKTIGSGAFKGIDSKATIKCPKKQKTNYEKLLRKKGVSKTVKFK